jgi:hypothetical protein
MKRVAHRLDLIVVACAATLASFCDSKKNGGVDARSGTDASFCVYAGTIYAGGESFVEDCRTCSCSATGQIECQPVLCLSADGAVSPGRDGSFLDGCLARGEGCVTSGGVLAAGEVYTDGCSKYSCGAGGNLTCVAETCRAQDASVPAQCSLSTTLAFGYYGGLDGQNTNVLDMSGTLTITLSVGSCSWSLPSCGTPCAVTAATVAADLADADVQAAFAASSRSLYGISMVPQDGADYIVTLGNGRTIQVGGSCCLAPEMPCQPIPTGVRRLVQDLQSLVSAAAAVPPCNRP